MKPWWGKKKKGPAPEAVREHFLAEASAAHSVLEIGPFGRPCIKGPNVRYFDVLDTEALRRRAASGHETADDFPHIDYVDPSGDLSIIPETFDVIVSSHCIEHQPDLIHHLIQVETLLKPAGRYFLVIPDKRYCFDHFLAESTIASIIDAHVERRKTHRLASVIEHLALRTHNDPVRHWSGDHVECGQLPLPDRVKSAMSVFEAAKGGYVDVHAWQFTPESFRRTMQNLHDMNFIGIRPTRVCETPFQRLEFTAILER